MNWTAMPLPPIPTDPVLARLEVEGRRLILSNPVGGLAPSVLGACLDMVLMGVVLMQVQHWMEHCRDKDRTIIHWLVVSSHPIDELIQ